MKTSNKFNTEEKELVNIFNKNNHPLPELKNFLANPNNFLKKDYIKGLLKRIKEFKNLDKIPKLSKDLYTRYERNGKNSSYEEPYNQRRENLSILAFLHLIGKQNNLGIIENYLISICEEDTWVMPFHKGRVIDLYSADTAFILSEIIFILRKELNSKIYNYVKNTINEKVLIPYLDENIKHKWYKNNDNWNSVCNSEIGCTFLLIENNNQRKSKAIRKVLQGLEVYIQKSFKNDGSTEEGVHYWNYGMSMFTVFSEMLRASTKNKIDLLQINKIKNIAKYPTNIQLGLDVFATFSDCSETGTNFHPGILQRLSERTKENSLLNLITENSKIDWFGINFILRYILWWDGESNEKLNIHDAILKDAGIVRLTNKKTRVISKAGDNNENHNHNDVGSFIVNFSGENFITDPGAGLYSKGYHDYQTLERYKNIFTNSYGHSVPKINKKLQSSGKKYFGNLMNVNIKNDKFVKMDISNAYDLSALKNLLRKISIRKNDIVLADEFIFSDNSSEIEEAFITWLDVAVDNEKAIIYGEDKNLELIIEQPKNVNFELKSLEKESKENKKSKILKRVSFRIPKSKNKKINVKINMVFK